MPDSQTCSPLSNAQALQNDLDKSTMVSHAQKTDEARDGAFYYDGIHLKLFRIAIVESLDIAKLYF